MGVVQSSVSKVNFTSLFLNVAQFKYHAMPTKFNTYSDQKHYKQVIHFLNK